MGSLVNLGLTETWLSLCSADSPLTAGATAHLLGIMFTRKWEGPGTWHLLCSIGILKVFLYC